MRKIALLIILGFTLSSGKGQNTIGLPDIINYSKLAYSAGAQNRQIRQDKNGIVYFANNEGVLTYDGRYWKVYPLPNKSIVRSIEFGPDNRLYVGGQDEIGFFATGSNGQLVYHSLKEKIPQKDRSFTDVWSIVFYHDDLFFQTSTKIYQVSGEHCSVYESANWRFMAAVENGVLAQEADKGLLLFTNGVWTPLNSTALPKDFLLTSAHPLTPGTALLATRKHGLYKLTHDRLSPVSSSFLSSLSPKDISGAIPVNDDYIAITTNLDGCYIIDKEGNRIQNFSTKEGLQNNNIITVFLDKEKNIWLGMENGIDFIAYNNAIKHINPEYFNSSSGYASIIHDNHLYIGTANGLYKTALDDHQDLSFVKGEFEKVENTSGQVWNLSEVNGELFMGHHDGSYIIRDNKAVPLDNSTGFWNFNPLSNLFPSPVMLAGNYEGVNFYSYKNGQISKSPVHAAFESARFIVVQNNNVWSSHPYKGVYKISVNGNNTAVVKQYSKKEGVSSSIGNYIFRIRNRIVLTTSDGVFEYNESKDTFEPSAFYNSLFGKHNVRYLKEDNSGNIWFVFDKRLSVVDFSSGKPQVIYFPELTNKMVSGFEQVYPINENNVLLGGEKGFYHINYKRYKQNSYPLQVQIRTVKAFGKTDSLLFGGYAGEINTLKQNNKWKEITLDHSWNSIHFEYASPSFGQQSNIEYSYFLEGFDKKWSEFSGKTEKEYTNLPAGSYVFYVKVRNNLGNESAASGFTFKVLPPWYQTGWAYASYGFILLFLMFLVYRKQHKKFQRQRIQFEEKQKQMLYMHQLEIEKNEKEIIQLKNEKLEGEIQHKNTELASTAMHLVQKGELLTKIKDELQRLNKTRKNNGEVEDLKKIIRILTEEEKMNEDWEHFAVHFNKVHSDFLITLKEIYPQLSAHELKVCAYLRMNLSSKEIAQLMNISVRGVDISRYRLRKKLGIPTKVNLFQFLFELSPSKDRQPETTMEKEEALS
jgi:DNA-binding CsgD family transcriptional regulator